MNRMSCVSSTFSVGFMPGGGFVEQQQLRLGGQRADDFQPALVAVGQTLGRFVAELAQVEDLQQFHDLPGDLCLAVAKGAAAPEGIADAVRTVQLHGGAHVVEHAHAREQPDVLKGAGDAQRGEPMRLEVPRSAAR